MVVTTTPMNIQRAANVSLLLKAVLGILVLLSVHVFLIAVLTSVGNQQPVTADDNVWLLAADAISVSNPDVAASLALYQRNQSLLVDQPQQKALLDSALAHWQTAIKQRPLWPYHHLGALDIEVMLNSPAEVIQQRIETIIRQTPNERGMDKPLLELALFSWPKLSDSQQGWMIKRMQIIRPHELRFVIAAAEKVNRRSLICANLPLKKIKRYCR